MEPDAWTWKAGVILSPFGRNGELKIRPAVDAPEVWEELKQVCLVDRDGNAELKRVTSVRFHQGNALLTMEGIADIGSAEPWTGGWVQLPQRLEPVPEGDEYRVSELVGLNVVTTAGRVVGPVDDVLSYPAYDMLQVGEALIPAVKAMIKKVDRQNRTILVEVPDGLLPDEHGHAEN